MGNEKYQVIQDPIYGYRRLDPVPDEKEVTKFYENRYYDLIRKGGRASDVRRLMAGGEDAEREREWLHSSLYADILSVLEQQSSLNSKRLLDVGCGTGELISFMKLYGWEVIGLEPSSEAAAIAKSKGLEVYSLSTEEFLARYSQYSSTFAAITLLHVLEHVPSPVKLLKLVRKLLVREGVVVIQVPNDFTELQLIAQQHLQKEPWWIAIPDHINYFDFQSLHSFLQRLGFEVIYSQGDFPMELFLLMSDDYVGNSEIGSKCHQKRVRFEMAITGELRRHIYRALAEVGVGRNCLVFGRLKEQ